MGWERHVMRGADKTGLHRMRRMGVGGEGNRSSGKGSDRMRKN